MPTDPPLLLVNGLGSQCINYRVEWCERFVAAGHFVIRFDNRDVGLSSRFPDTPYTLSDMAADAVAVLDDLAIERAHVMGLSMGGMIVQTMAIEHPESTADDDLGDVDGPAMPTREGPAEAALQRFMAPPPVDRASYIAALDRESPHVGQPGVLRRGAHRRQRGRGLRPQLRSRRPDPPGQGRDGIGQPHRGTAHGRRADPRVARRRRHADRLRAAGAARPRRSPVRASCSSRDWATTTRRSTGTSGWSSSPRTRTAFRLTAVDQSLDTARPRRGLLCELVEHLVELVVARTLRHRRGIAGNA